ncbi:N-acetylmuramoyl-L-alanine amidase [Candidatus Uhrbacteria bacterium]|nr:N-acetylmuramoyl-L-alanine amidase [Candidatus Uhrbacteria bacterium]
MPKLYLIAGHTQGKDEGAQNLKTKETENLIARNILLQVFPKIKEQIFTDLCPFDLTLDEQTKWINKRASENDYVVCCHLNSSPERKETGALCFYYGGSEESKEKADKFLKTYCQEIGLRNAGLLADTQSRFGRLGIVRDTKGWSFLLEMGSINNDVETVKVKGAQALIKALQTLVGFSDAPVAVNQLFADVPAIHPDFEAVKWAKEKGVAAGYPDGRLGVDEPLKVGRFLSFLKKYDNLLK